MSTPRFLVAPPLAAGTTVALPDAAAHHAQRVLRLREGDAIVLFDGHGNEFQARLVAAPANASRLAAAIAAGGPCSRESRLRITLIQALCAQDKTDLIVEKAVELGAVAVVLVPAQRSVVRLDAKRAARRAARLQEIAAAACAQCGRNVVPAVHVAASLPAGLAQAEAGARVILDPRAGAGLQPGSGGALALAVGPEGGFTAEEIALALTLKYVPARLGARVLRTETAGLAALCAALALAGEYGSPS